MVAMHIDILTLFPDSIQAVMGESILGRAQRNDIIKIEAHQIRNYTKNKQMQVDDYPYGGGRGAVMQADPLYRCWAHIGEETGDRGHTIYLSPCGRTFTQAVARELKERYDHIILVCGHYEGVDQRILDAFRMEEISIGDYILTGGELAAMVLVDAFARLVPGVLGNELSPMNESIYSGLLEYDQYTKPREYGGMEVPEVLYNGNHKLISLWQFENSLRRTKKDRPDLLEGFLAKAEAEGRKFTKDEKKILDMVLSEQ
jgi:tRNA (guanine-N1)-methyltransferase